MMRTDPLPGLASRNERASVKRTVLVVDDEPAILRLVRKLLEPFGFTVLAANSAREALTLLDHHHIDALLTDVVMPEMNGAELIEETHRRFAGLPVCCMSGHVKEPHPALDRVPLIQKPFERRLLIETLLKAVEFDQPGGDPSLHPV